MSSRAGDRDVPLETKYELLCEYCDFLKDHVFRLSQELSEHQDPDSGGAAVLNGDPLEAGTPPPWLVDQRYLSPLLVSYDSRLEEKDQSLKEKDAEIGTLKRSVATLNGTVRDLVEDNERLGADLSTAQVGAVESEDWNDMREHTKILVEEKRELLEQVQHVTSSAEQAKQELEAKDAKIKVLKDSKSLIKHDKKITATQLNALQQANAELERRLSATTAETVRYQDEVGQLQRTNATLIAEHYAISGASLVGGNASSMRTGREERAEVRDVVERLAKEHKSLRKKFNAAVAEIKRLQAETMHAQSGKAALQGIAQKAEGERRRFIRREQQKDVMIGRLVERLKAARYETVATQDMSRLSLADAAEHINEQARAHKAHAHVLAAEMGALHETASNSEQTTSILLNQQRMAHRQRKTRQQFLHEATLIGDPTAY